MAMQHASTSTARDGIVASGQTQPRRTGEHSAARGARAQLRGSCPYHRARIQAAVETVIEGKPEVVRLALTVLLAEGHLLIEDVPGVGKTMLAKALARSIDCSVRRIQFTPDLLPSDITGVSRLQPGAARLRVQAGRRSSPTSSSATRSTAPRRRPSRRCWSAWRSGRSPSTASPTSWQPPFMVVATQNPIEMEGTYPLPEAQRDRFMARVSMGYPSVEAELAMLDTHGAASPLDDLEPVADAREIAKLIEAVRDVHVVRRRYAVRGRPGRRRHPALPRPAARRLAARHAAPAARRARRGRARRPRLRAARRRPGARRPGARAPAAAHRRGAARPPHRRAGRAGDPQSRPGPASLRRRDGLGRQRRARPRSSPAGASRPVRA